MEKDSKLVPILREGIEVVKVIFYKELRGYLQQSRPGWNNDRLVRVTAAVVNDVFGVQNQDEAFMDFAQRRKQDIDEVRALVGVELVGLRIPLTDALRTMVLCDYQEGRDTSALLYQAQESGILLVDRELPLPNHFIELVRRLGTAMGILRPVAKG